jgi:hypothetical protein
MDAQGMSWQLRPAGLADTTVYAVPLGDGPGTSVLGWVQQTPGGWRRYPPSHDAPLLQHPELAILDLIEFTEHEGAPDR